MQTRYDCTIDNEINNKYWEKRLIADFINRKNAPQFIAAGTHIDHHGNELTFTQSLVREKSQNNMHVYSVNSLDGPSSGIIVREGSLEFHDNLYSILSSDHLSRSRSGSSSTSLKGSRGSNDSLSDSVRRTFINLRGKKKSGSITPPVDDSQEEMKKSIKETPVNETKKRSNSFITLRKKSSDAVPLTRQNSYNGSISTKPTRKISQDELGKFQKRTPKAAREPIRSDFYSEPTAAETNERNYGRVKGVKPTETRPLSNHVLELFDHLRGLDDRRVESNADSKLSVTSLTPSRENDGEPIGVTKKTKMRPAANLVKETVVKDSTPLTAEQLNSAAEWKSWDYAETSTTSTMSRSETLFGRSAEKSRSKSEESKETKKELKKKDPTNTTTTPRKSK